MRKNWLIGTGAGALGVVTLAATVFLAIGPAGAQTATPSPGTPPANRLGPKFGFHGFGGPGIGFGTLHGEFTVVSPNGGYETLATQVGSATTVSSSSITVKSDDGFSRTYSVDDSTVLEAGRTGISGVKTGDTVHVLAVVTNGNARAVELTDLTMVGRSRQGWAPMLPFPPSGLPGSAKSPAPSPSSSAQ
jgi:hypothetical protein